MKLVLMWNLSNLKYRWTISRNRCKKKKCDLHVFICIFFGIWSTQWITNNSCNKYLQSFGNWMRLKHNEERQCTYTMSITCLRSMWWLITLLSFDIEEVWWLCRRGVSGATLLIKWSRLCLSFFLFWMALLRWKQ